MEFEVCIPNTEYAETRALWKLLRIIKMRLKNLNDKYVPKLLKYLWYNENGYILFGY